MLGGLAYSAQAAKNVPESLWASLKMSVRRIQNFSDFVPTEERWGVYLLAQSISESAAVVKIGRSSNPLQRFASLMSGLAFPSMMKWAPVRSRGISIKLERHLHARLAGRNTAREWFLFGSDESETLDHEATQAWIRFNGKVPDWWPITEKQVWRYQALQAKQAKRRNR